jgi:hypothetical protein
MGNLKVAGEHELNEIQSVMFINIYSRSKKAESFLNKFKY